MNENIMFICAQLVGTIVFILTLICSSKLTAKEVMKYNALSNFLAIIQYVLLGAYSGAICCLIAGTRDIIFSRYKKKIPLYILLIYIALVVIINYSFINNVFDIIPVINIIVFAIALWSKDILSIKVIGIYTCVSGVIYDFRKRAFVAVIKELIDGFVGLRSLLILRKNKLKAKELNNE